MRSEGVWRARSEGVTGIWSRGSVSMHEHRSEWRSEGVSYGLIHPLPPPPPPPRMCSLESELLPLLGLMPAADQDLEQKLVEQEK